jgi:SAM-dependent methyltransferase
MNAKKVALSDFDTELAKLYDETRPIDPNECLACFKDAFKTFQSEKWKIADIGCGTGRLLECLFPHLEQKDCVVGVDISPAMIGIAKSKDKLKGVEWYQKSAIDFYYNNPDFHQYFDVVICHWLFHCTTDWESTLRACTSLASKSGILMWLKEDGNLYQALDGELVPTCTAENSLKCLFDAYWNIVNRILAERNSSVISPSSRAGASLRCTKELEIELAKWGWRVDLPSKTRGWNKEVTVQWIIDKILSPRIYTNLRRVPSEVNTMALKELKDSLGRDGLPQFNDSLTLNFRLRSVIARSNTSKLFANNRTASEKQATIFLKIPRRFLSWCRNIWQRREEDIRVMAEARSRFIPFAVGLMLMGSWGIYWKINYHPGEAQHAWGEGFIEGASLLLAVFGFIYAIYAIKGLLERPRDLNELLIRTTQLIKRFSEKEHVTAVMLCEYPAWGSLSLRQAPSYLDFKSAIKKFKVSTQHKRLVLIAPSPDEMSRRIALYEQDYGRSFAQVQAATKENRELKDDFGTEGFQHWEVDEVPRYQMLLFGSEIEMEGQLEFLPLEAIIWFAPRNSDIKEPKDRKITEWEWSETDVSVLAWQTTDIYILREIYDCARYYIHRDCGVPCATYREFLGEAT